MVETGRAGSYQTPSAAREATLSSCGNKCGSAKRYSRRQWLSDTRSIQVVLFQLRVDI